MHRSVAVIVAAVLCFASMTVAAQSTQPPPTPIHQDREDDLVLRPAEPDFTLIALPTGLRVARHKSAFRVTHRFLRPLGQGDFGNLLENFFGFDSGAQIGLEYRFGLFTGTQVGIHRTSDRTIQFFGQQNLARQELHLPVGVDLIVTAEGMENFRDTFSSTIGVIVSRLVGERAAFYVEPMFVANSNPLPADVTGDNHTFLLGLGTRLRLGGRWYIVGEFAPRVAGFDPGIHLGGFAIEWRAGGHMFQINFSDGFATTLAQVARGGFATDTWFIGFNISRKFY